MTSPNTHNESATNTMSPITTNGNWFWKDGQRFLIKGLTYAPRNRNVRPYSPESYIDPLGETWLPELRKDIPYFHELGINAISVDHADISQPPDRALQLLREAGIYVLLDLFTNIDLKGKNPNSPAHEIDLQRLYSPLKVRKNLVLVSQTANHPNVLGYSISLAAIGTPASTKLAALHRAAVRDTKLFLRKSGCSRQIPVGTAFPNQMYRTQAQRFMAAGEPAERIDFFSFGVYDWAFSSDFFISGYKGLVEALEDERVPMFFGEYGAAFSGKSRGLGEVECLFSPKMTGVFSGGFLHTYGHVEVGGGEGDVEGGEDGGDEDEGGYDLVRIRDDGTRRLKKDYGTYQHRLRDVAGKPLEEICGEHEKEDYESWRGAFQGVTNTWLAVPQDVPVFPLEWSVVLE